MKINLYAYILIFIGCLLFGACSKGEVYYQFKEIKNGSWSADSLLVFDLDTLLMQKDVTYTVKLEITNNISYPYQNLWLFSAYVVNDSVLKEKELECILADKRGVWKGEGFGSLYQSSHQILQSHRFEEIKGAQIYVKHGMSDSILHGIEKVGIKIEKLK